MNQGNQIDFGKKEQNYKFKKNDIKNCMKSNVK